jgi:signal transduction histidine kinase
MVRERFAKWKASPPAGERSNRASILLPLLIISVGLGVLAWRSYQLSARMEHGVSTLAQQHAGYAANITASRIDATVGNELFRATEEWQQVERRYPSPTSARLQSWIEKNQWILSAIYIPDADPEGTVYASETPTRKPRIRQTQEFYTSRGVVRYTYDPERLLVRVRSAARQQPLVGLKGLSNAAVVDVVPATGRGGPLQMANGYGYLAPLDAPLSSFAVRAFVATGGGSSWENARVISLWVSAIALLFTALGAALAMRGLKRESETMKLRGALIANVSHELRTPLSMIRLGAETLKRSSRLTEKQRHDIEESILREVLLLSHMVENVLDVARMQNSAGKAFAFTPVEPRELLNTLVSTYESWIRSKGFTLAMHVDDGVDEQSWDRDSVSRAVLNLIDNAIKYSGDEKTIQLALRQTPEHVVIEVRDRGVGIEHKDIARIFDPYYRAQFSDTQTRRGAGLGLTLVQQILASHGGKVEVESQPGAGSTFRLLFPRATPEPAAGNSAARLFVEVPETTT